MQSVANALSFVIAQLGLLISIKSEAYPKVITVPDENIQEVSTNNEFKAESASTQGVEVSRTWKLIEF